MGTEGNSGANCRPAECRGARRTGRPTVRSRLAALAIEIPPPDMLGPDTLRDLQKAEIGKWWPIIKAANIRVE